MTRDQFLRRIAEKWPIGSVLGVATVLHEGWELDNYIALVHTGDATLLVTTDHGNLTTCAPEALHAARRAHDAANESIDALLRALDPGWDGHDYRDGCKCPYCSTGGWRGSDSHYPTAEELTG